MSPNALLKLDVAGTVLTALCCFTPLAVWVLGALGLATAIGRIDAITLSALAVFAALTVCELWKRQA